MTTTPPSDPGDLRLRLKRLGFHGLADRLDEIAKEPWLKTFLQIEEDERQRRSLERRLANAHIGTFKPMADFDWDWPKAVNREDVDDLFTLKCLSEPANVVVIGPNGTGKTMITKNLAHHALMQGHTVRVTTASEMLNDLASQGTTAMLNRRLRRYCSPEVLVVDEVGYLSYDNRYADLLFEVVTRRYNQRTTVVTTNKPFSEWGDVFPNAACVVTLIDRLVHKAEIITIEGESYRVKEARDRAAAKAKQRASTKSPTRRKP